jgi:hypothetical protein
MATQDIDDMLNKRTIEPSAPGFAERIIASSRALQQQRPPLRAAWKFPGFLVPHQAFALAAMLVAGVTIGLSIPAQTGGEEDYSMGYMEDNGAIL